MDLTSDQRARLVSLGLAVSANFNAGDWLSLGVYTGRTDRITSHPRLLRSLNFGDDDYEGCVFQVLESIAATDSRGLGIIEEFVSKKYPDAFPNISSADGKGRSLLFTPNVFDVPEAPMELDLVAVMCPFTSPFEEVFNSIRSAASAVQMRAIRAKDIWDSSAVIQDVFSLIFRAQIVVCDFTGKNPNVFYEAGIAHTLGKHVVPITQSEGDIPFDLRHHRFLTYLNNGEGRLELTKGLTQRFSRLR